MKAIFAGLTALLTSIHTFLYSPSLPTVPEYRPLAINIPQQLTLPVPRLGSTALPPLTADSYLLIDQQSGEELASRQSDKELFPASTTKIMTAILTLENRDLDEVVTIPSDLGSTGSSMKLVSGERITVRNILTGLLIHSSNDAAVVLAQTSPGGTKQFVTLMNEKAKNLQMLNTRYKNPSGLFEPGHTTTVRDLLILARYAMRNPIFASLVKQSQATIKSTDGKIVHQLETTNELLGKFVGIEGIKTGWTEEAGECFVAQATRDGHTLLSALLKSNDRFKETAMLLDWGFNSFNYQTKPILDWVNN